MIKNSDPSWLLSVVRLDIHFSLGIVRDVVPPIIVKDSWAVAVRPNLLTIHNHYSPMDGWTNSTRWRVKCLRLKQYMKTFCCKTALACCIFFFLDFWSLLTDVPVVLLFWGWECHVANTSLQFLNGLKIFFRKTFNMSREKNQNWPRTFCLMVCNQDFSIQLFTFFKINFCHGFFDDSKTVYCWDFFFVLINVDNT